MAQIHVEPKSSSKWPYVALAIIVIAAIWLLLSRNANNSVTNSAMRDSAVVRDSVAGTLSVPPDTTRLNRDSVIRDSIIPPINPPAPR